MEVCEEICAEGWVCARFWESRDLDTVTNPSLTIFVMAERDRKGMCSDRYWSSRPADTCSERLGMLARCLQEQVGRLLSGARGWIGCKER